MIYNLHYDIAAIIVNLAITLHFLTHLKIKTRVTKQMSILLFMNFLSGLTDIIDSFPLSCPEKYPYTVIYLINSAYMIIFFSTSCLYYSFILAWTKKADQKYRLRQKIFLFAPVLIQATLVLTTPLTNAIFYFDENLRYCHGNYIYVMYALSYMYFVAGVVRAIICNKRISKGKLTTIIIYTLIIGTSVIIQSFFEYLLISVFGATIALLLIYLCLENPEHFEDKATQLLNKKAFYEIASEKINRKKNFSILAITITGMDHIMTFVKNEDMEIHAREIALYLTQIAGKRNSFIMSENNFAILLENSDKKACLYTNDIIYKIENWFEKPFNIGNITIKLTCHMSLFSVPQHARNIGEIMDLYSYTIKKSIQNGKCRVLVADNSFCKNIREEKFILNQISDSLKQKQFKLFYQPIIDAKTQKTVSADVYLKIDDNNEDVLSLEKFNLITENKSFMQETEEIIFNEICSFISQNDMEELGLKNITVCLSALSYMKDDFSKMIIDIAKKNNVSMKLINFSLSESTFIHESDIVKKNIELLSKEGASFSLNKNKNRFSFEENMTNYPIKTIKMHSDIIGNSFGNKKVLHVLEQIVKLYHDLDMKIEADGIGTELYVEQLEHLGCDYLQGTFFSKPLSEEDFINFLGA